MAWIAAVELFVLFQVTRDRKPEVDHVALRRAWVWLMLIPVGQAVFTMFRAGAMRDLALVEIWASGLSWFMLGMSLWCLMDVLIPPEKPDVGKNAA